MCVLCPLSSKIYNEFNEKAPSHQMSEQKSNLGMWSNGRIKSFVWGWQSCKNLWCYQVNVDQNRNKVNWVNWVKKLKWTSLCLTSVWLQRFLYCLFSQLIDQLFALQKCWSVFLKGQDDILRCHVLSTTQKYLVYCHKEGKKQEILVDYQNSWLWIW